MTNISTAIRRFIRWPAGLLLTVTLAVGTATAQNTVRPIMQSVFDTIAYLLPLSLSGKEQLNDLDAELVSSRIEVLSSASDALTAHASQRDQEFQLLTRSFDRSVDQVRLAFDNDRPIDAFYVLMDLTQSCAACHSRLPDSSDSMSGQKLMARMNLDALDLQELAQLYVATRQFSNALNTLEKVLMDPNLSPVDIELDGTLIRYLNLSLAVTRNVQRAGAAMRKFLSRSDVPFYLRRRVETWLDSMDALSEQLTGKPSLLAAQSLFDRATESTRFPGDRNGAIHDLVAASMLRGLIESRQAGEGEELARSYLMLGVITLRTLEPDAPVPQLEFLLESAIRAAPQTAIAEDAYALLQEVGYVNYPGLSSLDSTHPLIDMKALHELMERSAAHK
jgi:hypothetical protein